MRERWGTFSVRDHVCDAPFVSDVLLYDRLVIPVPDREDDRAIGIWAGEGWKPDLLQECLDILKVKTDEDDGLALTVSWDKEKRNRFASRMSTAAALATQKRAPDQTYYMDPFHMTRELVKGEFRPALPKGVSKAWTVAAYPSKTAYHDDMSSADPERSRLAAVLRHRFFTPASGDPDHEMLKRAVDLSNTDDFRRKRRRFYEWQEEIIEQEISADKAMDELGELLAEYNGATQAAFADTVARYAFTVIPIGLALTGAAMSGGGLPLVIGGAAGLVQLTRFWKFDRKQVLDAGDLDAAAMVQDSSELL